MMLLVKSLALAVGMFLLITSVLASSNDQPPASNPMVSLPAKLRQIMSENRERFFPPLHPSLEDIVNSFVPRNLDEDEHYMVFEVLRQARSRHMAGRGYFAFMHAFGATVDFAASLTHEQLGKEIQFLFDLLRHGYDGYLYFGGDDVFLPIRDATLERLASMSDPLLVYSYLNDLLVPAFQGVIADNHFLIQHIRFGPSAHVPFMSEEFILRRGGGGFVTEIDRVLYKVIEVKGLPSPSLDGILPTLTPGGEFAWVFGLVTPDSGRDTMEITVRFEDAATNESHSRLVNLQRVDSPRLSTGSIIARHEIDGVTILENRRLSGSSRSFLPLEDRDNFLRSGYELRDVPVLVMDLRGNTGGNGSLASQWVKMYTGQEPQLNSLFAWSNLQVSTVASALMNFFTPFFTPLHLLTPLYPLTQESVIERPSERARARDPRFAMTGVSEASVPGSLPLTTSVSRTLPHVPIPNENFVIVLTDKNIGSAGELFVGYLRQLENVLVVGTNTAGAFLNGNVGSAILPYSGLAVRFGTQLNLRHDLSQFEGVGFMPDLWVPPGESLERVLRFVKRHGLQDNFGIFLRYELALEGETFNKPGVSSAF